MKPQVIALYSPCMGMGKGEVAKFLDLEGYGTIKFADPIKGMIKMLLNVAGVCPFSERSEPWLEGELKELPIPELHGVSPRRLMQTLGNEWGREYVHPEVWVQIALRRLDTLARNKMNAVIDDMRFPLEFEALKDRGALMVKVVRPGVVKTTLHASEGRLDKYNFDVEIVNDGTIEDLRAKVATLVD